MKLNKKSKKAVIAIAQKELRAVNKKIATLSELPFVTGYSETERVNRMNELFSQKRKLQNDYAQIIN